MGAAIRGWKRQKVKRDLQVKKREYLNFYVFPVSIRRFAILWEDPLFCSTVEHGSLIFSVHLLPHKPKMTYCIL